MLIKSITIRFKKKYIIFIFNNAIINKFFSNKILQIINEIGKSKA